MRRYAVLATAMQAAAEAGAYIRSQVDAHKNVKIKTSLADVVTDVDPACEEMIRRHITYAFPDHAVLGEETTDPGMEGAVRATAGVADAPNLWVVDPLDGTTNFVAGLPLSVVSIGYAENGQVCVGVVYDPYRDELFYALQGAGAYVTDATQALQWSQQAEGAEDAAEAASLPGRLLQATEVADLNRSIVATGFPARGEARARTTEAGLRLSASVKSVRALGAAALHLAYVAAGRLDAFWEYDLNAWDLAGGVCLVQEAGGTVRQLGGGAYGLEVRDIIVSGRPALADAIELAITVPAGTSGA